MGEGVAGAATSKVKSVAGGFIRPSLDILKSWQGIVEIVLRGVAVVLAVVMIIAGAACQDAVAPAVIFDDLSLDSSTRAACGWLIFVGILALLYEVVVILVRFLNIGIINSNIMWVLIIDAIVHGAVALAVFAGAVACAAYVQQWRDYNTDNMNTRSQVDKIISSTGATAAFGFLYLFTDIAIAVFVMLGALVFKWNPTLAKYSVSEASSSPS